MSKSFYVYILSSKRNGTLYVGVTNNIERRIFEHKTKLVLGFTQKYHVDKLVYLEEFSDPMAAIGREKRLKKYERKSKIKLIERDNHSWRDLAEDWYESPLAQG